MNKPKLFYAIGLLLIILALTGCGPTSQQLTATIQAAEILTLTAAPTSTPLPTFTPTPSPTPTFAAGDVIVSPKDGMKLHYVPAGEFTMGDTAETALAECRKFTTNCQLAWFKNEAPPHKVRLDAFWIDETEVTNRMYALCVAAGACQPPNKKSSLTRKSYYDNAQYEDYPVIYVPWDGAKAYCEWAGRILPSEAQWEKAARWKPSPSGGEAVIFPWGNDAPSKDLLNYNSNVGETTKVGLYPNGASPYGAYDMAGNVWEWVNDWYDVYPGGNSSVSKDFGQKYHVLRGGSWYNYAYNVRTAIRVGNTVGRLDDIGFRCALTSP